MIRRLGSVDLLGLQAPIAPGLIGAPGTPDQPWMLVVWGGPGLNPSLLPTVPLQIQNFGATGFNRGLLRVRPAPIGNLPGGFLLLVLESPLLDGGDVLTAPIRSVPIYIRNPAVSYDIEMLPTSRGALVIGMSLDGSLNNQIFSCQLEFFGVT